MTACHQRATIIIHPIEHTLNYPPPPI